MMQNRIVSKAALIIFDLYDVLTPSLNVVREIRISGSELCIILDLSLTSKIFSNCFDNTGSRLIGEMASIRILPDFRSTHYPLTWVISSS